MCIRDRAKEAGAAAIVVSNHGGRVLDQCPATAEVLPEIAAALTGTGVQILVDGGIRTGVDVFKALALGADGVLKMCIRDRLIVVAALHLVSVHHHGGHAGDQIDALAQDVLQRCV